MFCRNSGTEDKTAVYVQCRKDLEPVFLPIGEALAKAHRAVLKNRKRLECRAEELIMARLAAGPAAEGELLPLAQEKLGAGFRAGDLSGVLYGLKKENRIRLENGKFQAVDEQR